MLKDIVTKEWLFDEYVNKSRTIVSICKELKCSRTTIFRLIKLYEIKLCGHEKRKIKIQNQKFGKWTALKFVRQDSVTYWLCRCDCGLEKLINGYCLRKGYSNACPNCRTTKNFKGCGNLSKTYWSKVLNHAKLSNREVNITITDAWNKYLEQNGKCALTGMNINIERNYSRKEQTASLDRIDSSKGYIAGNIQWVHKDINSIKGDYPENYFITLCSLVYEHKVKNV